MPERVIPARSRRLLPLLALVGVGSLGLLGGCSFQTSVDKDRGRDLFTQKCGTCHALAQAGTKATIGPDLDAAFADARENGFDSGTFEGVVRSQIAFPRPSGDNPATSMPADLVKGQDADDVAAYVASVAGVPGIEPPAAPGGPGGQVFANNGCGSCHTLKASGSSGTTGPDLDEVLKGQEASQIEKSIVDPGADLTSGFPNVMPTTFKSIPPDQLKLLVDFLLDSVSGGGSPSG